MKKQTTLSTMSDARIVRIYTSVLVIAVDIVKTAMLGGSLVRYYPRPSGELAIEISLGCLREWAFDNEFGLRLEQDAGPSDSPVVGIERLVH